MPYRKPYRKKPRRKRRTRRMRRSKPIVLSGFPRSQLVKMRYVDQIDIGASILGSIQNYSMRANSIFDPDFSGIGHQPMAHDQWQQVYDNYIVIGSKITVSQLTPPPGSEYYYGVFLGADAASINQYAPADLTGLLESKLTGSNYLIGGGLASPNYTTGKPGLKAMTKNFSCKKFFGVRSVRDNDDLSARFGSNPTRQAFFTIWGAGVRNQSTDVLIFRVIIDYICLLREPIPLPSS